MSTTTELLNKLNVLRAANGERELKSWKESRAKLEQRIRLYEQNTPYPDSEIVEVLNSDDFEPELPPYKQPQPIDDAHTEPLAVSNERAAEKTAALRSRSRDIAAARNAELKANAAERAITADDMKRVSELRKKPATVRETMDAMKAGTVTLADIARELKLNPKVLRAKMRRLDVPAEYIVAKHTYKLANKDAIIDIIRKDHRRK